MKTLVIGLVTLIGLMSALPAGAAQQAKLIETSTSHTHKTDDFADRMPGFSKELSYTYGVLKTTGAGTVTYTYLGSEADYTDSFGTSATQNVFSNHGTTAIGSTFSQIVGQGTTVLDFRFSTLNPAYSVSNAANLQGNGGKFGSNEGVFGIVGPTKVSGKNYSFLLIYNDPVKCGDKDFNDLVVGVNFTPAVPEPETYSLFMAGLGLFGFMMRRRKQQA